MKLTAILLLAAALQVSANGFGQRISLSLKNASLEKAFTEIEKQSGYSFVYGKEQLAQGKPIDLTVNNETLESVLDLIFKGLPLTYTISGKYIAIKQKVLESPPLESTKQEIPPPIDVHGRVVNEKGQPMNVVVTVKGTSISTSTDENGFFTLKGVDENATLVISAVNIEPQEVKINGKIDLTTISVKLKVTEGQEVLINTGYQKLKINEVTGSVVQINNDLFNRSISTDIYTHLNGLVSGMVTTKGTDNMQGRFLQNNFLIRSYSTILSNKQPLIILDNFPYVGDGSNINPNDVESVTILKDAAAASIWGSKAGNGVIVITTKTGKYNRAPQVSFSTNITSAEKTDIYYQPILSSSDFIGIETFLFNKGVYNGLINSPNRPALTPGVEILLKQRNGQISSGQAESQLNELRQLDVRNNLQKYYFDRPSTQQYGININGGSISHSYFLSLGYDRSMNSLFNNNRITLNATNSHFFLDRKLEITTGLWLTQTELENIPAPTITYPYAQLADANGNPLPIDRLRKGYVDTAGGGKLLDWQYYPLKEKEFSNNKTNGFNYRINVGFKYKIIKGLDAEVKYAYERQRTEINNLQSIQTYATRDYINQFTSIDGTGKVTRPVPVGGILDTRNILLTSQNLRGQLNYSHDWHSQRLSVIAGAELGDVVAKSNAFRYYGYDDLQNVFPVDFINSYKNYITGNTAYITSGQDISSTVDRSLSFYGNAAYVYKSRYSLSASMRKDGSNIFGANTNNKWKPLWSAGAIWNINKESFYKVSWLPEVKLRTSYGYQGNANNSVVGLLTILYQNLDKWNYPYASILNPPNPYLRWEKVGMFNLALDFGLKHNRISGSIDFYWKNSKDLIGDEILPPSSGSPPSNKTNTADMRGRGIDITINTRNTVGLIKWNTTLLLSHAKDWVTNYRSSLTFVGDYVQGGINPIIGNPVSSLYSLKWAGLDPATGDPQGYLNNQISKDYTSILNSRNLNELVYSGPTTPPYFGSLLNTIEWKSFSLSANVIYKFGYFFRRNSINYSTLLGGTDLGHIDYLSRWQKPGDEIYTNVPSMVYPPNSGTATNRDIFYSLSEVLIEKGDNIRLQDIRISYNLSKDRHRKLPFKRVNVYLYVSNLGIIWKANNAGIDPDYIPTTNLIASGLPGKRFTTGVAINF